MNGFFVLWNVKWDHIRLSENSFKGSFYYKIVSKTRFVFVVSQNLSSSKSPKVEPSPTSQAISSDQNVEWESYTSDEYGYTIQIPKGWTLTNTPSENSREISITHPGAKALVLITGLKDDKLKDVTYMKDSIKAFKQKIEKDPSTLQLSKFIDSQEGDTGGFIAIGEEKREGLNWYFDQRGILKTDGRVLLFHGAAISDVYKEYKDIISQIIESFRVTD